jgi:hypothetical protein
MPVDVIFPLKYERFDDGTGTQFDEYQSELDPDEDYIGTKGIVFEANKTLRVEITDGEVSFTDNINGTKKVSDFLQNISIENEGAFFKQTKTLNFEGFSLVDEGNKVKIVSSGGGTISFNVDGGRADSIYTIDQVIDGGSV